MDPTQKLTARERKVLALVMDESLPPAVIAERLRSTPGAIREMLRRLRRFRGIDVPRATSRRPPLRTIRLPLRVMRRLQIIASRHGLSSGEAARRIFAVIERENLFEELMERGRGRTKS